MDFENNDILALLSGEQNYYLAHIEKSPDVSLTRLVIALKSLARPTTNSTCN